MTLDQLRYFVETARQGHLKKAGRALAVTPSTVSHAIATLERGLGVRLFDRRKSGLQLTDAGRLLLAQGDELLVQAERLRREVTGGSTRVTGCVRIAATHGLAEGLAVPAWSVLSARYPELTVAIASVNSATAVTRVLDGEADLALCFSPLDHPSLVRNVVHRGVLRIVVRRGHPVLKSAKSKQLGKLSEFPAVAARALPGVEVCETHPVLEKHGITTPRVVGRFDSNAVGLRLVAESDAWALLPGWVVARMSEVVVPLDATSRWDAPYVISVLRLKEGRHSAVVEELIKDVEQLATP